MTNHKIVQYQEIEMEKACNVAHSAQMYRNARGPGRLTDCLLNPNQSAKYFINIFAGTFSFIQSYNGSPLG